MKNVPFTKEDAARVAHINGRIAGWSGAVQYAFFKAILGEYPNVRDVLMLGVYQGRDLAYLLDVWARYYSGVNLCIAGVDKFSDTPCDDWPAEKRALGWQSAGFGPPPSKDIARGNLAEWPSATRVALHAMEDGSFLNGTADKFDLIYIDTSHDYETVARQLRQVQRVCRGDAVLCGDDYSDQSNAGGSWGVKKAVSEAFTEHEVFGEWIWFSTAGKLVANQKKAEPAKKQKPEAVQTFRVETVWAKA